MRSSFVTMAVVATSLMGFGCGKANGPELAPVLGTITLDGQPLPEMNIQFAPEATGGSPSFGGTNADGEYRLLFSQNRKGAVPGKHRVEITPRERKTDDSGNPIGQEPVKLPAKYRKPGALSAEVKPGANTIDFRLDSQPDPADAKKKR
ncbi:MAG: hypothetical protein SH850_09070 [Planctomycetaceae bacterium]|nr:hypothetical protein [Planctomycetaceae bacterium]